MEFFGKDKAGKTTLVTQLAVNAQKAFPDKTVLYIDSEGKFSVSNFVAMGGDIEAENFILLTDKTLEKVTEVFRQAYTDQDQVSLIIWDSFGATASAAAASSEDLGDNGEFKNRMAREAVTQAEMLRRLADAGAYNSPPVVLTNQVRTNLGGHVVSEKPYGGTAYKHKLTHSIKVGSERDSFILDQTTGEVYGVAVSLVIASSNTQPVGRCVGRSAGAGNEYFKPVKGCEKAIILWVHPDSVAFRRSYETRVRAQGLGLLKNNLAWWYVYNGTDSEPALKFHGEAKMLAAFQDEAILSQVEAWIEDVAARG